MTYFDAPRPNDPILEHDYGIRILFYVAARLHDPFGAIEAQKCHN